MINLTEISVACPTSVVAVAALTVLILLVVTKKQERPSTESKKTPPVSIDSFQVFYGNFLSPQLPMYLRELCHERMGEKVVEFPPAPWFLPSPRLFVVTDFQTARRVLEHPRATKWDRASKFFVDTTSGDNLVTSDGHRWKHVRKSTSAAFSTANIHKMVETIRAIVHTWMEEKLNPAIQHGTAIDILDEMNKLTSDVILEVAFDYKTSEQEREMALAALETCWIEFGDKTSRNPLRQFSLTRWMFEGIRAAKAASNVLADLCRTMIADYRAKSEKQPHKLIHALVNDTDYNDDAERISDMIAYMIAGFDTTANTLAFGFRELALRKELQTEVRDALNLCNNPEEARSCPLLKRVVRETLRMYPAAAAGSVRSVEEDIPVANSDKTIIPAGSVAITSYYAIQRDSSVYKDPDEFLPGRWENPNNDQMQSYMTFSAGRRNCQGQALAYAELHEVLSMVLAKYEFDIVEAGEPQNIVLFKPVGTLLSVKLVSSKAQ